MDKKNVIVTGASGSIGFAIAKLIAMQPGYRVYLIGRDEKALFTAAREITAHTGNRDVYYRLADLSVKKDIRHLASQWEGPLQVLVNNAAICPRSRIENAEGIEMQFATNVLGYHRMIESFEMIMKASAPARIVNVASYWAGGLDMDDLEFRRRQYNNDAAYRQSKQADRMLSRAFADRYSDSRIAVNACHPGDVNSKLSNSLGYGGHETPAQGAATPVWLATSEELEGQSGKYFEHRAEHNCSFSRDLKACHTLMSVCSSY